MNLTKKDNTLVAFLSGWTLLHLVLLFISHGNTSYFWPFDEKPELSSDYDASEFFAYGVIPWVIFVIYKMLNKAADEKEAQEKKPIN